MRGSGDSEGMMEDMYTACELNDARDAIAWIAAQPWCDGTIGMFGTSWGGTASLQAAVDAPEPLKAVIANCATADRFEDDIHWMGGALLTDSLEWGATLPAILAAPPDVATVGDRWWALWQTRLDGLRSPLEHWISQKNRGAYWRHGSVRFAAHRLTCPILAVGGWADRYSNAVMGLVEARPELCWGVVGPWGHHYPDHGEPGPAISFQDLALDWWQRWLGPAPQGAAAVPKLRLWRRTFDTPQDRLPKREGTWCAATPSQRSEQALYISNTSLSRSPPTQLGKASIPADICHGAESGDTGYFGRIGGMPLEQSSDDEKALIFDSVPFEREVDIVGGVTLEAHISRTLPEAHLVSRLCDVAPDGRSNLIIRTVRNLALDDSLDASMPFCANEPQMYRIAFPTTAYRLGIGHRLRLALAQTYWPLVWPVGAYGDVQVDLARSKLVLPHMGTTPVAAPFSAAHAVSGEPSHRPVSAAGTLSRRPARLNGQTLSFSWNQPMAGHSFPALDLTIQSSARAEYSAHLEEGSGLS